MLLFDIYFYSWSKLVKISHEKYMKPNVTFRNKTKALLLDSHFLMARNSSGLFQFQSIWHRERMFSDGSGLVPYWKYQLSICLIDFIEHWIFHMTIVFGYEKSFITPFFIRANHGRWGIRVLLTQGTVHLWPLSVEIHGTRWIWNLGSSVHCIGLFISSVSYCRNLVKITATNTMSFSVRIRPIIKKWK